MADSHDRYPHAAVAAGAGSRPVPTGFTTTAILIALYLAIGVALLPLAGAVGPELPGFNALFAGGVFVTEGLTSFLLMMVYRREPRRSVLLLVAAYLFSAVMSLGYLMAYPAPLLWAAR